jgi:peptide/nickel transport system permease protein
MSDSLTVDKARAPEARERKHPPFLVEMFTRLVKGKPQGTIGGVIVLLLLFVGIFADLLAPYGYNDIDLDALLQAPSASHLLGTDNLGRDLLSRIIYGARVSMYVGLGVATLGTLVCTVIGGVSGFFGGKVDLIVQRFVDAVMCFPGLVIILTVIAVIGPGLVQVILVLGILGGIGGRSRVVRSAVLGIRQNVYVEAARSVGASNWTILQKHILPNIMAPVIILFTIEMGSAILIEATLSFLGLGIPPPNPSWGGMLSGSGRQFMLLAPWMALWPGVALALVVYGINMLGDGLRDILDPRLRGGLGRYTAPNKKSLKK